ncbi:MAG: hypothetical protein K0R44_38 [Thermomicrobiales bacterium]|jgi:hypothetical protein|nr:hypothetical protein [Thermomicrobiales bacterium]MDF3014813.1 hypothetical protein [Thermomicrobiales bacterium]
MASNLAGNGVCIGAHDACLIRAAKLDPDCSPKGGADSGIITAGIVTMTASPDIEEGQLYEPKTGCGTVGFTVEKPSRTKRVNLTGELLFHDEELMEVLFGGKLILGGALSDFNTDVIGWAEQNITEADPSPIYLEIITRMSAQGAGECSVGGVMQPYAQGHIFGKARLTLGDETFENDVRNLTFTGVSVGNPALFNGPWNDWPGITAGSPYIPNSPRVKVKYSQAEYNDIAALAGCGYRTLPAAS